MLLNARKRRRLTGSGWSFLSIEKGCVRHPAPPEACHEIPEDEKQRTVNILIFLPNVPGHAGHYTIALEGVKKRDKRTSGVRQIEHKIHKAEECNKNNDETKYPGSGKVRPDWKKLFHKAIQG